MVRYRPTDDNGDMMPIPRISYMLQDADAVGAAIKSRLSLLAGEWWEDEEIGFSLPGFIIINPRSVNPSVVSSYVSNYITSTDGVKSIRGSEVDVDNHSLKYRCRVQTEWGMTEGEVDTNGIFGSVSR